MLVQLVSSEGRTTPSQSQHIFNQNLEKNNPTLNVCYQQLNQVRKISKCCSVVHKDWENEYIILFPNAKNVLITII